MGMGSGGSKGGGYAPPQQNRGGLGGKGKGGSQQPQQPIQQTPYQPPAQNPYAQQYYQPQFQPDTFNNPYAQVGFGQQPQMGGFGGKGGQMGGYPQQGFQGGMGGKGGQMGGMSDLQRMRPQGQQTYQDYASSPTQEIKMSEEQFNAQQAAPAAQGYARDPRMGGMGGKGGQMGNNQVQNARYNPPGTTSNVPQYAQDLYQQLQGQQPQGGMGGMGGKGGQMGGYSQMPRGPRGFRGAAQQGLAALQQPTATTQAVAPEQPYMGNYLQ